MSTHLLVTRAKAGISKPLKRMNRHATTTLPLSRSHVHALHDPNWKEAMLDEYNALVTNRTWVLVRRLANVNVVCSIWLIIHKFNADGSLSTYKAHLMANGHNQQQGIDCDETFSPMVKPDSNDGVLECHRWKIERNEGLLEIIHGSYKDVHEELGRLRCKVEGVCEVKDLLVGLTMVAVVMVMFIPEIRMVFNKVYDISVLLRWFELFKQKEWVGSDLHVRVTKMPLLTDGSWLEYIELLPEKARRRGEAFNWQTSMYVKMECEDLDSFVDYEADFLAIVYDDPSTSSHNVSS
uniref:Ribonuclease H-like domain-containing protein n=1 Tax=Tanacetum cinerariifolium TaxID=118510 RepID=A0A699GGW3_TANCI|nr:ribonuclease H-like domain-containing protein [Tanacetum cinerariifolium]